MSNTAAYSLPAQPFELPGSLTQRYEGDRYVSRLPFLLNELVDDKDTISSLREIPIANNQLFMGIAGFRSLDMLSTAGKDHGEIYRQAILFDNNEAQVKVMNGVLSLIGKCATADEFKEAFTQEYLRWVDHVPERSYKASIREKMDNDTTHPLHAQRSEDENFFGVVGRGVIPENRAQVQGYFQRAQQNPNSWLQPENYARIRDLAGHRRIATASIDLTDPERFNLLHTEIQKQGYTVGTVYLSSLLSMLSSLGNHSYHNKPEAAAQSRSDRKLACGNLLTIASPDTRFLVSDDGLFVRQAVDNRFLLKSIAIDDIRRAGNESDELNAALIPYSHSEIFAVEKRSYRCSATPVFGSADRDFYRICWPHITNHDAVLRIYPTSPPKHFQSGEIESMTKAINDVNARFGLKPQPADLRTSYDPFLVHIPAQRLSANPMIVKDITNILKTELRKAAKAGRSV